MKTQRIVRALEFSNLFRSGLYLKPIVEETKAFGNEGQEEGEPAFAWLTALLPERLANLVTGKEDTLVNFRPHMLAADNAKHNSTTKVTVSL